MCSSKRRLEVHHNSYENLGHEPDEDLTVVCHDCHEHFHRAAGKRRVESTRQEPEGQEATDLLVWKIVREVLPQDRQWDATSLQDAVRTRCAQLRIRDIDATIHRVWDAILTEVVRMQTLDAHERGVPFREEGPVSAADARTIFADLQARYPSLRLRSLNDRPGQTSRRNDS